MCAFTKSVRDGFLEDEDTVVSDLEAKRTIVQKAYWKIMRPPSLHLSLCAKNKILLNSLIQGKSFCLIQGLYHVIT